MSIRSQQTSDMIEQLARQLYTEGHKPSISRIERLIAQHFSDNPAGHPLALPIENVFSNRKSDPDEFNALINRTKVNLDVLYRVLLEQLNDVLGIFASADEALERLGRRRDELERQVDDALIVSANSGGYYHSVSDGFRTLSHVDLNSTSAQVDIDNGTAQIPSRPSTTQVLPPDAYSLQSVELVSGNGQVESMSPFSGAVHGKERNTYWSVEVRTSSPQEVALEALVGLSSPVLKEVSRLDFTPYGATAMQIAPEGRVAGSGEFMFLGDTVVRTVGPHTARFTPVKISQLKLTMRKTDYDQTRVINGSIEYIYQFGFKRFELQTSRYDRSAQLFSISWELPAELADDGVLDAVVLEVDESLPPGTEMSYYVSSISPEEEEALEWHRIKPLNASANSLQDVPEKVSFKGSVNRDFIARRNPEGGNETQLLAQEVPDQKILPGGADLYKLFSAPDTALLNSLSLVEGINTTSIRYMNTDFAQGFQSLAVGNFVNGERAVNKTQGRIDDGTGFFYGGDVGRSGVAVLVEAMVECDSNVPVFLEDLVCTDSRSVTWDVRVLLNGSVVGECLSGSEKVQIPWSFKEGRNHIALVVRMPEGSYLGQLELMRRQDLWNVGTVLQERWKQVALLDLADPNLDESAPLYAVMVDGQIVTARQPTDNFRLSYRHRQGDSTDRLVFRVDMSRSIGQETTPLLRGYRLRYAFSDIEDS